MVCRSDHQVFQYSLSGIDNRKFILTELFTFENKSLKGSNKFNVDYYIIVYFVDSNTIYRYMYTLETL